MPNPRPYIPFYVSDHYRLGVLHKVSLEASGLYMRLLAIAWDSVDVGRLVDVQGRGLGTSELAQQCGVQESTFTVTVDRLLNINALRRLQDGTFEVTLLREPTGFFERQMRTRELTRQRVARYRDRKKGDEDVTRVTRYPDIDIDKSSVAFAVAVETHLNGNVSCENKSQHHVANGVAKTGNGNGGQMALFPFETENFSAPPENGKQKKSKRSQTNFNLISEAQKILEMYPRTTNYPGQAKHSVLKALEKTGPENLRLAVTRYKDLIHARAIAFEFVTAPEKWFKGQYEDFLGERWERVSAQTERAAESEKIRRAGGKVKTEPESFEEVGPMAMDELTAPGAASKYNVDLTFDEECRKYRDEFETWVSQTPPERREECYLACEKVPVNWECAYGWDRNFSAADVPNAVTQLRKAEKRFTREEIRAWKDRVRRKEFREFWEKRGYAVVGKRA